MARAVAKTEANRSGSPAVRGGKHSRSSHSSRASHAPIVLRRPPQYGAREVEVLLEALWGMFTETQASKLVVTVPWDSSEEPHRMVVADLASLLESWL